MVLVGISLCDRAVAYGHYGRSTVRHRGSEVDEFICDQAFLRAEKRFGGRDLDTVLRRYRADCKWAKHMLE